MLIHLGFLLLLVALIECDDSQHQQQQQLLASSVTDEQASSDFINKKILENVKNLLNPHYIGIECYEQSIFPPDKCSHPLYGFCSPYVPSCSMWRRGMFATSVVKAAESTPRNCSSFWSGKFESGIWDSPGCPITWFTPEELR